MSGARPGFDGTRSEMDQAIKRLGVLEQLFLMIAAVTALIAGALVAWLVGQAFGTPYRPTWAVSSLALFLIPGGLSWWRVRREQRAEDARRSDRDKDANDS